MPNASNPTTHEATLLEQLLDVGERLQAVLMDEDLGTAACLLHERRLLVERLRTFPRPEQPDAAWERIAAALLEQQKALRGALITHERRLSGALEKLAHQRQAHHRYHPSAPTNILSDHVHG